MGRNFTSRTITGSLMLVLGFILIGVSFSGVWVALIYGILILILGFYIIANKDEDKIEKIKTKK